jgi:hypothetical protein
MSDQLVVTRHFDLAAHWLACGLQFVEASAVEDPFKCVLTFHDPAHRERDLTRGFFGNEAFPVHHYARARRALVRIVRAARTSADRRCDRAQLLSLATGRERADLEQLGMSR